MLRLSIIVPYRQDDSQLEATILSVLENRPRNSELIVVHDGTYRDPYELADELSFIEFPSGTSVVSMLNAACELSEALSVCSLLDGVTVAAGWADEALHALESEGVDAVAVRVQRGQRSTYGISRQALRKVDKFRSDQLDLTQPRGVCAGPLLDCGFYCRDSLLAIGGWHERFGERAAEVEMALLLSAAEWQIHCAVDSSVSAPKQRPLPASVLRQLAELAVCHEIARPSFAGRASEVGLGCLTGRLSQSLAWLAGLKPAEADRRELAARKRSAVELADDDSLADAGGVETDLRHPSDEFVWRRAA